MFKQGPYYRAHTVLGAGEREVNRLSPDLMGSCTSEMTIMK